MNKMIKEIELHGLKTKVKKTFDLFGVPAYVGRSISQYMHKEPYISDYWGVYLEKEDGNFGRIGNDEKTMIEIEEKAKNKIISYFEKRPKNLQHLKSEGELLTYILNK